MSKELVKWIEVLPPLLLSVMTSTLEVGLSFVERGIEIDRAKFDELNELLGAPESSVVVPTFANIVLSGVARQLADSGAVPQHGVVHTAEATTIERDFTNCAQRVDATLAVTKVRDRAGVVQFETTGTITDDAGTVAVVVSTLTYREGA